MSGAAQKVSGASFSKVSKGRILSIRDYLVGEYLFGASKTETVKNRANPALPLIEVGVITALTKTASGSGGTDGTYNLIFTGGSPTTAAAGTFVVVSGAVTTVTLTGSGQGYQSAPTVSLANCPGLTGATVTATRATPTYNTHSAVVKSHATLGYGFQSQIVPDEDYTFILVRKNAAISGSQVKIAGMAPDPVAGALWTFAEFSGNNYGHGGESSANNSGPNRATPSAGTIYFEAIVHQPLANTTLYYGAGGVLSSVANGAVSNTRRSTGTSASPTYSQIVFGTGALTDSITTNSNEIYFAAIYNRRLSSAEAAQCYADVVAYLATQSVTVA